jgi:hypothetical protein
MWHVPISAEQSVIMIRKTHSGMIFIASTLNRPYPSLTSIGIATDEFDQQSGKHFSFCREFGRELFK